MPIDENNTIDFFEGMNNSPNISPNDKLMIGKDNTGEAERISINQLEAHIKNYLSIDEDKIDEAFLHSEEKGNPHDTTFTQIVDKPTTIEGYGITDSYTKAEVEGLLGTKIDSVTGGLVNNADPKKVVVDMPRSYKQEGENSGFATQGLWTNFVFLYDKQVNGKPDFVENISPVMGEIGRIDGDENNIGFTYIKNDIANGTNNTDAPQGELRIYENGEVSFFVNNNEINILQILNNKIDETEKGQPNGVAPLNSEGIIDEQYLPPISSDVAKIPDWEEGQSYNKNQTVIVYEGDNAVVYRSLTNDNDSSPLFTNPWEYVGEVSNILNWDGGTTYNLGDKVLYPVEEGGGSLVVLFESRIDSPSSNPLEGMQTGEWIIQAVLADPVGWDVNTEYSPYGGSFPTVVSYGSSYYSTLVNVIGVNPLSTNQWEKVSNLEFDEKNFRIVDGKVYLGEIDGSDDISLSSTDESSIIKLSKGIGSSSFEKKTESSYLGNTYHINSSMITSGISGTTSLGKSVTLSGVQLPITDGRLNLSAQVDGTSQASLRSLFRDGNATKSSYLELYSNSTNSMSLINLQVSDSSTGANKITGFQLGNHHSLHNVFIDQINEIGLRYSSDYSANGSQHDRWIPDYGAVKAYVDEQQGAFNLIDVPQTLYIDKAISVNVFNNTGMTYSEGSIDFGVTRDTLHTMGLYAFKQGVDTRASGNYSSAFGNQTKARGNFSSAFGNNTDAYGHASASFGDTTTAFGLYSASFGRQTTASGIGSSAFGIQSIANEYASLAIGRYSTDGSVESSWTIGSPVFKVGNGTGTSNRSNAYTLYNDGRSEQIKDVEVTEIGQGVVIKSPDGTRWRITVDNNGDLTTTSL